MRRCRPSRDRRGFTLVELLIVVGIIAVLVGMLLPALNRVRIQAERVNCSSNMRQFTLALTLYAHQFHTYPYQRFNYSWGCFYPDLSIASQAVIDGYNYIPSATLVYGPTGPQNRTVEGIIDGIFSWPIVKILMDMKIVPTTGYRGIACTSNLDPSGLSPVDSGWYFGYPGWRVENFGLLPNNVNPRDIAFFAYNGPGVNTTNWFAGWNNPIGFIDDNHWVDNVRPWDPLESTCRHASLSIL